MVWIEFILSAAVITFAAMQLAKYGDVIGLRTGLGGMFVGTDKNPITPPQIGEVGHVIGSAE